MAVDSSYQTWSNLPYHIVKRIYEYLGDDCILSSTVCKHWRDVVFANRSLWKKICIFPSSFPKFEAFKNPIMPIRICSEIKLEFNPFDESHLAIVEAILNSLCSNIMLHSISLRPTVNEPYSECVADILDRIPKTMITSLCEVIMKAKCLKHFYWVGGFHDNDEVNRVLRSLKSNQKHNLLSLQIIRLFHMNQSMLYLDSKSFLFFNLSQFSTNYLHLSEDILLVLTKNASQLRILKLFVQNSIQGLPLIRNQVWRHVHETLPNFRVNLFLICVKDLKILVQSNLMNQHMSFISDSSEELNDQLPLDSSMSALYSISHTPSSSSHTFQQQQQQHQQQQEYEQQSSEHHYHHHHHHNSHNHSPVGQIQMNQLLSERLLPSALPLDSISIYYSKPDPLSYLIQYLMDTFATSLKHFYLIDTFSTVSVMSNNSSNVLHNPSYYTTDSHNIIRFIANAPTTTILKSDTAIDYDNYDCVDSDYQSMFSSHSSYHSLLLDSTSDFDILSCDSSHDFLDYEENSSNHNYYSGNLLIPISTSLPLSSSSGSSSSMPVLRSLVSSEQQSHQLPPSTSKSSSEVVGPNECNTKSTIVSLGEKNNSGVVKSTTAFRDGTVNKAGDNVVNSAFLPVANYSDDITQTSSTNIDFMYDNHLYNPYYQTLREDPQSLPSSSPHLIFYSPNLYKTLDDVDPDPFVMLAWRCQQLSHFTLIGYWFNIVDMKAFTALRGTSLKSFHIPRCCISVDDQSWSFNLDENLNEILEN
ncbi:unnamed protein product [Trichobilharzia szidati]|nr:unnamed protein product [Trichobilharzia szidati]